MKKFLAASVCFLAFGAANSSFADDYTKSTTVQEDSNGNYHENKTRSRVDANGDSVNVNTDVNADANGDADVSKKVERTHTDAYGDTDKRVSTRTANTNGSGKVTNYEEYSH